MLKNIFEKLRGQKSAKSCITFRYMLRISHHFPNSKKIDEHRHHGHHCYLSVQICGTPDPQSGLIIHRDAFNEWMQKYIVQKYDQTLLNHHITPPTGENLIQKIETDVSRSPFAAQIKNIHIDETIKNGFTLQR